MLTLSRRGFTKYQRGFCNARFGGRLYRLEWQDQHWGCSSSAGRDRIETVGTIFWPHCGHTPQKEPSGGPVQRAATSSREVMPPLNLYPGHSSCMIFRPPCCARHCGYLSSWFCPTADGLAHDFVKYGEFYRFRCARGSRSGHRPRNQLGQTGYSIGCDHPPGCPAAMD